MRCTYVPNIDPDPTPGKLKLLHFPSVTTYPGSNLIFHLSIAIDASSTSMSMFTGTPDSKDTKT